VPRVSIPAAIGIILGAAALAVLAMTVIRRIATGPLLIDPTRGTSMATVVGSAFAILLAFIIVDAFQTYSGAKTAAQNEATTTLEMFRTAGYFPPARRDAVRSDIVCYARAVAYSEWPAMRDGHSSPLVVPWIDRWNDALRGSSAARQHPSYTAFLTEDDARTSAGVSRFRASSPSVPTPLWVALLIGACVAVALQLALTDPREKLRVQGAMVAGVATVLAAGLVLVSYLDHPYSGEPGSVKPSAMQFTLAAMGSIGPGVKPPCAADGRPLGAVR
jgi:hypothetical protein